MCVCEGVSGCLREIVGMSEFIRRYLWVWDPRSFQCSLGLVNVKTPKVVQVRTV